MPQPSKGKTQYQSLRRLFLDKIVYRGLGIYDVKGSVCLILTLADFPRRCSRFLKG